MKKQRGQAMVYGLFVVVGALAGLFYLFSTGQLAREKTKLVNTSDAVAYSAGIMHARTLNYEAYTNRAMLANTVAIAQLVSIASWVQFVGNMADYGYVLENPKFLPYYPAYLTASTVGQELQSSLNESGTLEDLAQASDTIIRNVLMNAQQVAYAGLVPTRQMVMDEVAQANYANDGTVSVDQITLPSDDFPAFVTRYTDDDRTRFADAAKTAANLDAFVPHRSWSMPALWADCPGAAATGRLDWLDRRGGTDMIGFDEWKAMDTLSEKRWVPMNKFDVMCRAIAETPAAWGARTAADNPSGTIDPMLHDKSLIINPAASAMAMITSETWGYSGIPNFYDLSQRMLGETDPRLRFVVRLRRSIDQTVTPEGRSAIRNSGSGTKLAGISDYRAQPAGGNELVAISAAEVFFGRNGDFRDNVYGQGRSRPREIGSLFNPFWQVHLVQADAEIRAAQAAQGVVLP